MDFLALSRQEMTRRGWTELDVVLVTGDAYVDHPSFGTAVIGRILENYGYRVGIIAMPDWRDPASVTEFGKPRLFFGVTSGNVDSMLAHYTAFKRYRSDDPYVPGGRAGRKPQRALLAYCNLIKAAYKDVPLVIGGVEASMRRMAHYDFWSNNVRRSILEDSRADILVYGMGERAVCSIAERLQRSAPSPDLKAQGGESILHGIPGTVVMGNTVPDQAVVLPPEEKVLRDTTQFLDFYRRFYRQQSKILVQASGKRYLLHFPQIRLKTEELDAIYALPFVRKPHPSYRESIPAFEMIRHSVTAHRGCVSGCSFCSLGLHQGKSITSRSEQSILKEVRHIASGEDFKGHISDIGGPSANMYGFDCARNWHCRRESCLFPSLCPNLKMPATRWMDLLKQAQQQKGVSKVTIGSGLRYDLLLQVPKSRQQLKEFIRQHVGGQLKIAPEHSEAKVLRAMRKTPLIRLKDFVKIFRETTCQSGKEHYPLPYLMSCHPGSTEQDMLVMKKKIQSLFGFIPEQVQAFIPLPMTLSSVIYYTGVDPLSGERFEVVRDMHARRRQHEIFFTSFAPRKRKSSHKKPGRGKRSSPKRE